MKAEFKRGVGETERSLIVNGDLIGPSNTELKNQLLALAEEPGEIQLCLKGVEAVDVSAIQLIKRFRESLQPTQKLRIVIPESENLINLLKTTGLIQILR